MAPTKALGSWARGVTSPVCALKYVLRRIEQVAPLSTTVLIEGETGVGKALIARAIHDLSPRSSRLLVKVDRASLPASLIEAELFGHERGAFTAASGVWPYPALVGDFLFVGSFFVLSGEFWDKIRSLFVWDARAILTQKWPAGEHAPTS